MQLDDLNSAVTEAIFEAEALDDGESAAPAAYHRLSVLEERIAAQLPAGGFEGAVARRGAVRAAVAAGDLDRAHELVRRYSEDPEASDDLRLELVDLLPVARTTVLTFDEFAAPLERVLSRSGRICRLGGQCPALQYMGTSFERFVKRLRRQHDWVVLTAKAPSGTRGRRHPREGSAWAAAPPRPVWPGDGRVGYSSFHVWEAAFSGILKRSNSKCVLSGDCNALPSTGDEARAYLDQLQRDYDLVLLKSDGEPWTSEARLARLKNVAAQVATRKASSTPLDEPATGLIRKE